MADLSTLGLGGQIPSQTSGLEQLATMFLANNQPRNTAPRMITAGGQVLGRDVTPTGGVNAIAPALSSLAQNYLMIQQTQKRNQFLKSVNDIMGSNANVDDTLAEDGTTNIPGKKSQLLQVLSANPDMVQGTPLEDLYNTLTKDLSKPAGSLTINKDTNIPEGMEITGYDQKGQPMIRKVKIPQAQEKRNVEIKELEGQIDNLINFFRDARKEVAGISGIGKEGIGGRLAGKFAVAKGKLGYSPKANAYQDKTKAFATVVAKAAGEVRPTDEDIRRFIGTLPTLEKNDIENETLINELMNDLNARGAAAVWKDRISKDKSNSKSSQIFNIGGKTYNIPPDKIEAFKKAKGIK